MNLIELNRALHQLRLGGMVAVLETRLLQAQSENMAPIDLISTLVSDEIACRSERLLARRHKQAQFRDANKQLDNFDFQFNPKMNRSLIFDLAAAGWVGRREDSLFLGPPGSGKSHIAQAVGHAVIQLPRALSRGTRSVGRTCRCHAGWQTQAAHGTAHYSAAADYR
jgi:DNA replication protein DnaC